MCPRIFADFLLSLKSLVFSSFEEEFFGESVLKLYTLLFIYIYILLTAPYCVELMVPWYREYSLLGEEAYTEFIKFELILK